MTTYKGIKGSSIQSITTDAVASQVGGGTWSSSNNMNTARYANSGAGTQTAALAVGGFIQPGPVTAVNESYDGSSWTEVADISSARFGHKGSGSSSLGFVAGGEPGPYLNATEEWTITHTLKKVTTA